MGQGIMGRRGSRLVVAMVIFIFCGVLTAAMPAAGQDLVWGTVPSPNRSNKTNTLRAVGAVSATDIWAVGEYNSGISVTARRTLAEHWDGAAWTIVASPNPNWAGVDLATLGAVAAIASNDVWAVGYSEDFSSFRLNTLAEHWDGSSWKIVPSPNPAGLNQPNQLFGVAAVASNNVWAVGQYGISELPLILHWDGARWKPVANSCGGGLHGVAALSATDIWAVGSGTSCHYDGTSWKAVAIAPSGGADILLSVAAISASDAWAVGTSTFCPNEGCYSISYSAHWNGSQWVRFPVAGVTLPGVLGLASNDVWAVGTYSIGTLILHWDGSAWSTVPGPNPAVGGFLYGITKTGPADLWAAGSYDTTSFVEQTMVLEAPSKTQGTLTGTTHFAGAVVSWLGAQNGSVTADVSGAYAAAGIPAGAYTVIVTAGGCTPGTANVSITAGQTTVQDFSLQCP